MNERDWFRCNDYIGMLMFIMRSKRYSKRKSRLAGTVYGQVLARYVPDPRLHRYLQLKEDFEFGRATQQDLDSAGAEFRVLCKTLGWMHNREFLLAAPRPAAAAMRDVYGNPFRPPPAFDPTWRTAEAVSLAQSMYDADSFDRMSELARALRAAGCEDTDILDHCNADRPHVRGCWVVDLVLGRE